MTGGTLALMLILTVVLVPLLAWLLGPGESVVGGVFAFVCGLAIAYFTDWHPLYAVLGSELVIYFGLWFLDSDLLSP